MGIASSVELFETVVRKTDPGPASDRALNADGTPDLDGGAKSEGAPNSALTAVSAYIPSEALAVYLAILAILNPPTSAHDFKILLFVLGLGLVCLFMLASFAGWRGQGRDALGKRIILLAFALLAFGLWAGAMPSSPFAGSVTILDFSTDASVLFGAGVIVAAALLPIAAKFFGLRPK